MSPLRDLDHLQGRLETRYVAYTTNAIETATARRASIIWTHFSINLDAAESTMMMFTRLRIKIGPLKDGQVGRGPASYLLL
jgi:hypothetical protein